MFLTVYDVHHDPVCGCAAGLARVPSDKGDVHRAHESKLMTHLPARVCHLRLRQEDPADDEAGPGVGGQLGARRHVLQHLGEKNKGEVGENTACLKIAIKYDLRKERPFYKSRKFYVLF